MNIKKNDDDDKMLQKKQQCYKKKLSKGQTMCVAMNELIMEHSWKKMKHFNYQTNQ